MSEAAKGGPVPWEGPAGLGPGSARGVSTRRGWGGYLTDSRDRPLGEACIQRCDCELKDGKTSQKTGRKQAPINEEIIIAEGWSRRASQAGSLTGERRPCRGGKLRQRRARGAGGQHAASGGRRASSEPSARREVDTRVAPDTGYGRKREPVSRRSAGAYLTRWGERVP